MHRFIDGEDRMQPTLLPHSLEDYVDEENTVRVIEVFIDELDLAAVGFSGVMPAATGRPAYSIDGDGRLWTSLASLSRRQHRFESGWGRQLVVREERATFCGGWRNCSG